MYQKIKLSRKNHRVKKHFDFIALTLTYAGTFVLVPDPDRTEAVFLKECMGARNREGIGLLYRPARLKGCQNRFRGIYS